MSIRVYKNIAMNKQKEMIAIYNIILVEFFILL